jgi:hypothetical protein
VGAAAAGSSFAGLAAGVATAGSSFAGLAAAAAAGSSFAGLSEAAAGAGSSFAGLSGAADSPIAVALNQAEIIKIKTKLRRQQFMIDLRRLV